MNFYFTNHLKKVSNIYKLFLTIYVRNIFQNYPFFRVVFFIYFSEFDFVGSKGLNKIFVISCL